MHRHWKIVLFWVFGALAIMFGSLIAGNIKPGLGVTDISMAIALLISFILILVGGLFWISVSLAMKKVHEE